MASLYPLVHFLWKMNFVWKMILIQLPAEKAYYIWAPIQYPSCVFCVENDFELTISWGTILHLSTQTIPHVCILYEKWFWINDQLRNHVTFKRQINSQYPSLSIVLIHILIFTLFPVVFSSRIRFLQVVWWRFFNRFMAEDAHYFLTSNQFTTPLSPSSLFTSGVSLSSLLSSPREFGSCKLCGKDFSIDSRLKMHFIQTNSQDLSLSFFLVHIWSLFSILV